MGPHPAPPEWPKGPLTFVEWYSPLTNIAHRVSGSYHLYYILKANACTGICFQPRGLKT